MIDRVQGSGLGVQIYAVILVGGKGKRLRPLSTDKRPKAFLSVTKDRKTMFRKTVERAKNITDAGNIIVVANAAHAALVRKDFPDIAKENLLLEPVSRNTAPAIALAAFKIKNRTGRGIMAVLPSDHYITGKDRYLTALENGIDFARRERETIVTIGIRPSSPSTELGYVKVTRSSGHQVTSIYKVEKFTEKPSLETARRYVKSGRYLWNSGMFIFSADTILKAVSRFSPKIHALLKKGAGHYKDMPDISIDYAVMEKARNIYCVKGAYGWNDIGNFDSLKEILRRESRKFIEEDGKVIKVI